jgi:lipoprotein NlpI
MRRWVPVFAAGLGICLGVSATAQTSDQLAQYCGSPNPEIRLLACTQIIEKRVGTAEALADAFTARGTAYSITGDTDRAIEDFDHALILDPGRGLVFGYRGAARLSKGDYDRAIADFSRAVEIDPDYAEAFYGRASALREKGDNDRAIADYNRVIELDPRFAEAIANRGIAYRAKDDIDHAIADFDRLIALNPNDAGAYNLRGSAYRDKGDADHAFADLDRALKLRPDDATMLDNRGFTGLFFGRFSEAGADFARAVELQPANPYNALWLDLARRKAGAADAQELSRNAAKLDLSKWPGPVIRLYRGETTVEAVRAAAMTGGNVKDQSCEAAFYIGEMDLLRGDAGAAKAEMQNAVTACPHTFMEYTGAARELSRLR